MSDVEKILGKVRDLSEKMEQGTLTAEQKTLLDGLNGKLDDIETTNAANTKKWQEQAEKETEFKQRIEDLEDQLINGAAGQGVDFKKSNAYIALNQYCKGGDLSEIEHKDLLRTDSENAGGILVATETAGEIIKPITEITMLRQYARVRQIGGKNISMPVRKGLLDAQWEGEAEQGEEGASSYGSETITPFRLSVTVPITMDQLMDSAFDMESEIMGDANERFAQKEGLAFVKGTGVKMPMGFTVDPRIANDAFTSANAGAVDGDDVLKLLGELKTGYNELLTFNRKTLAMLRTLKGSDGQYLWQPGLNGAAINNIGGTPYFLSPDMPDIASNATPIALADFRRGYQIVDRTAISVVRDEYTRKKQAIVEFTIHRWLTGAPVLPEAFKLLKVKA